jgi:hypothetical protein
MFELLTGLGLAMPAGLNAYIPLLALGIADRYFGLVNLAAPYDIIATPGGLAVLTILLLIELFADKVPLVDSMNDLIQSAVRPSSGAVVLMASTEPVEFVNPIFAMALGLLVAGIVHMVKMAIRPAITATTGGVGNPLVSAAEDGAAIGSSIIALVAPVLVLFLVVGLVIAIIWLLRSRRRRRRIAQAMREP